MSSRALQSDAVRSTSAPAPVDRIVALTEDRLRALIDRAVEPDNLREACRYAALAGGKRLRPLLAWRACEAVCGDGARALPAAVAVECVHAFSLVHDDLPALDDDDLRRGRPTLHIHAGEAMAVLAGDALLNLAFTALAHNDDLDDPRVAALTRELADGVGGMIAGQVLDTLGGFEQASTDIDRTNAVHRRKTGALIRAACRMGAISGHAPREAFDAITVYAEAVGLMFQIVDDLIDATQTSEHAGKRTGKDADAGKLTYPVAMGLDASRRAVTQELDKARSALGPLGPRGGPLLQLAEEMAQRTR